MSDSGGTEWYHFQETAEERFFHLFGYSGYEYTFPVSVSLDGPRTYLEMGYRSPAHIGPFLHAVDIPVPDPRAEPLDIVAPQSGRIIALKQVSGTVWGSSREFDPYLNFVTVQVSGREFYEICHIAQGSCPYDIGDFVSEGSRLAQAGLNGFITTTDNMPDSHVHMLVAKFTQRLPGFDSVRIRFRR